MRVENERCQLAGILCPRGLTTCWWSMPPIRLLCRGCFVATFDREPIV